MNKFSLLLICPLLLFSHCRKGEKLFISVEKKLQGEWSYTKANYWSNLRCDNRLDQHKDWKVQFNDDHEMLIYNLKTSDYQIGTWQINTQYSGDFDGDGDGTTQTNLIAALYDTVNNKAIQIYWRNFSFTRHKMNFSENQEKGTANFKLEKDE